MYVKKEIWFRQTEVNTEKPGWAGQSCVGDYWSGSDVTVAGDQ